MIVLDTHALVWWLSDPARLPAKARRLIDGAVRDKQPVTVSSISFWEVAMLVDRGRLERLQCMRVVRGAEHDRRPGLEGTEMTRDLQAVEKLEPLLKAAGA